MSRLVDGMWPCLQGFLARRRAPASRRSGDDRPRSLRRRCVKLASDPRAPAAGSRKLSVPTATSVAPAREQIARRARPLCTPPMPTIGIATARGDRADLRERDRADRRARQPAGAAAEPRLARLRGCERHPAQRVDQRDGVGAGLLRPPRRPPATSAAFGVSLTISGLAVSGRTRVEQRARVSPGRRRSSSPVSTFGQETLSSSAATSSRSANALDERGQLLAAEAHHVDDQRHRQRGELRAGRARGSPRAPCWAARSS